MQIERRRMLAVTLAGALAGCGATPRAAAGERITLRTGEDETASYRAATRDELLAAARGSRYVLLGELHDNVHHHARRGELIRALGAKHVVTEHLTRGARVDFSRGVLESLQAAGFDARGWGWPVHEALYTALAAGGVAVEGGNAAAQEVREVSRQGAGFIPDSLRMALPPLAPAAREALDADLVRGHCGQIDAARIDPIRAVQRMRDAAMALVMVAAHGRGAAPVVLVAGNGHVRRDYGVPQVLRTLDPDAAVLAVGFVETGDEAAAVYDAVWATPPVARGDPCAGFRMPARS